MSGKIGSKIASRLCVVCLLAIVLLAGSWRAAVAEEPGVPPYIPNPSNVYLTHENGTRYINVTVICTAYPMTVESWGTVKVSNGEAWANLKIWRTGIYTIMYPESHVYILSLLQPTREYTFTFKVWDVPMKTITFTYYCRPIDINGDGIIDIDDLARVGRAYGSQLGEPAYDPAADFNVDDRVDMRDLSLVGRCYGDS